MNTDRHDSPGGALASLTTCTDPRKVVGFKPVLSFWGLVLFGLAFVGPIAPYIFFGVGSVQSHGHFALVYLIAMVAVSFTAVSYGRMATAFPEAGSAYAYSSKAIHPVVGYLAGWVMLLYYLLMPMLCVIIVGVTSNKLLPAVPYSAWVILASCTITAINLRGIEMTSRATIVFGVILSVSVVWFSVAAIRSLQHGVGRGTLLSLEPFYNPATFSLKAVMAAMPLGVLSFLGFDGVSTLAEDAKNPQKNVPRATVLVCFIAGAIFILLTYFGQLLWPNYSTFSPVETAFSDIGKLIGGPSLFYLIAFLVVAQSWACGITTQASASRFLFGMARDGRLPHLVFGYLYPKRQTPIYSMLLMGGIALVGGLMLDMDKAAQLVNFGACVGFMGVNLAVIGHYFFRLRQRGGFGFWTNLVSPIIGFLVCLWILLSGSPFAMKGGWVWLMFGLAYLISLTHGFQRSLGNIERTGRA